MQNHAIPSARKGDVFCLMLATLHGLIIPRYHHLPRHKVLRVMQDCDYPTIVLRVPEHARPLPRALGLFTVVAQILTSHPNPLSKLNSVWLDVRRSPQPKGTCEPTVLPQKPETPLGIWDLGHETASRKLQLQHVKYHACWRK